MLLLLLLLRCGSRARTNIRYDKASFSLIQHAKSFRGCRRWIDHSSITTIVVSRPSSTTQVIIINITLLLLLILQLLLVLLILLLLLLHARASVRSSGDRQRRD